MGRKSYEELAAEAGMSVEEYKEMLKKETRKAIKKQAKKAAKKAMKETSTLASDVTEEERRETAKKLGIGPKEKKSSIMGEGVKIDIYSPQGLSPEMIKEMRQVNIAKEEMKFIVDSKYQAQRNRIACQNRVRAIEQNKDYMPSNYTCDVLRNDLQNLIAREENFDKVIDSVTQATPVGRWLRSIKGIGPTIAASLIAYLDIETCNYATHFLSYAGQNDQNRPWLGQEKSKKIVNELMAPALWQKISKDIIYSPYPIPDKMSRIEVFADDPKVYIDDQGVKYICMSRYNPYIWINNAVSEDKWPDVMEFMTELTEEDNTNNAKNYWYRPTIALQEDDHVNEIYCVEDLDIAYVHEGDVLNDGLNHLVCIKGGAPKGLKKITDDLIIELCAKTKWKFSHFNDAKSKSGAWDKTKVINRCAMIPYNKNLKTLMYKIADSFVKNKGRGSLYGEIYADRKAQEIRLNEEGKFADIAAKQLASKNFTDKKTLSYYENGKLSPLHIELRARRVAVRVFLCHVFEEMWWEHYNTEPPKFYPLQHLGHMDYIKPEVPFKSTRSAEDIARIAKGMPVDNRNSGVKMTFTVAELKEISARSGVKFEDLPEYNFDDEMFGEDTEEYFEE